MFLIKYIEKQETRILYDYSAHIFRESYGFRGN